MYIYKSSDMIWNSLFDSKVSQFVNAHAIKTTQWCQTCVFTNKLESWASSFFQWRHVHHGPIYQENSSTEYSEGQWTPRILQDALLSVLIGETLLVYICLFLSLPFVHACLIIIDYLENYLKKKFLWIFLWQNYYWST